MKWLVVLLLLTLVACSEPDTAGPTPPGDTTSTGSVDAPSDTSQEPTTPSDTGLTCWSAVPEGGDGVSFVDVTGDMGLIEPLTGMYGHTAIWTDGNDDGWADLYVGTFADRPDEEYRHRGAEGPSPDRLLTGSGEIFTMDGSLPEMFSRTSGGVGADMDGDGDLDLVVSRNISDMGLGQTPTVILENDDGSLRVVDGSGMPEEFGARSVGVLDYDGDGLLDLFIAEDRWTGGSSRLFHNQGGLAFSDATAGSGIPDDVHGLGVATADLDDDGLTDIFVAGSNRIFYATGDGTFIEGDSSVFEWAVYGEEDDVSGVSVADVDGDGLLDIALGHHYNSTLEFGETVPVRLYLNRGDREFSDVTEEAGLTPLPTKAPHVELNDFDNDGLVDLLASASADGGPAVFLNLGVEGGVPRFAEPAGLGESQYWVAAPTTDYDHDGRLDVFLVEWEPSIPSLLLRNQSASGNWLEVTIDSGHGHGIGWRVEVYDGDDLVGAREITVTQGYSAGVLPIAHFGLGDLETVNVRLVAPHGGEEVTLDDVSANQHIRWPDGCG